MESARPLQTAGPFRYVEWGAEVGERAPVSVLLLHGMIGGPGNWDATASALAAAGCRVLVPRLPVFERAAGEATVVALAHWTASFLDEMGIERVVAVGNSLGGHVATLLCLEHPHRVDGLVLLGSSGIDELDMGATSFRRRDRAFLRERAEITFHDPVHVTERLLDEIVAVIDDRTKALSILGLARSVKRETVTDRLGQIAVPTLVVWGRQDRVTPPAVAEAFASGIRGARLEWIDRCGHAPMMEHPEAFHRLLTAFLLQFVG